MSVEVSWRWVTAIDQPLHKPDCLRHDDPNCESCAWEHTLTPRQLDDHRAWQRFVASVATITRGERVHDDQPFGGADAWA